MHTMEYFAAIKRNEVYVNTPYGKFCKLYHYVKKQDSEPYTYTQDLT